MIENIIIDPETNQMMTIQEYKHKAQRDLIKKLKETLCDGTPACGYKCLECSKQLTVGDFYKASLDIIREEFS